MFLVHLVALPAPTLPPALVARLDIILTPQVVYVPTACWSCQIAPPARTLRSVLIAYLETRPLMEYVFLRPYLNRAQLDNSLVLMEYVRLALALIAQAAIPLELAWHAHKALPLIAVESVFLATPIVSDVNSA